MAKKNQTQNQPQNQACKIKEEHINDTIYINGNEWRLGDLSEKQIEEHLLPYKGLIHLVDGIEN